MDSFIPSDIIEILYLLYIILFKKLLFLLLNVIFEFFNKIYD